MVIDDYLPRYDVTEHHQVCVSAPAARTYAAVWDADLAASLLVKALFAVRSAPSRFTGRAASRPFSARVTLRDVLQQGFFRLGEEPGREVVIGVIGRFWKPTGNLSAGDRDRFLAPQAPGTARAAWNFIVSQQADARSLVTTETRVLCADAPALRSFRRYWLLVGPLSSLIRRAMLESIRATAEAA